MYKTVWLGLVSVALILASAALIFSALPRASFQPKETRDSRLDIGNWVQGIGYVEPVTEVRRLVFKSNGVIDQCLVEVGQRVETGRSLMVLKSEEQQKQVAAAEKELAMARADRDKIFAGVDSNEIAAAESKLELARERWHHARKELERMRNMFRTKASSEQDLDSARTNMLQKQAAFHRAEAELLHLRNYVRLEDRQLAEAKVSLAEARLQVARQQLADTRLLAPFAGTVLEILRREGEGARPSDTEPVLVFGDLCKLRVRGEIDERFARRIRPGQEAVVYGRGLGSESLTTRVNSVKRIMGKKTVFSRTANERKDLDILQVFIDLPESFSGPVGLEVNVKIRVDTSGGSSIIQVLGNR
jgi:HlyD family secretion protein